MRHITHLTDPASFKALAKELTNGDHLIAIGDAEDVCGLSRRQVAYAIDQGRLRAFKMADSGLLVKLSDLAELDPVKRGRPRTKALSATDCGHVI